MNQMVMLFEYFVRLTWPFIVPDLQPQQFVVSEDLSVYCSEHLAGGIDGVN